jgi:multidrug efflux pump subunit AcrB
MKGPIAWFVVNPVAANLLMWVLVVGGLGALVTLHQEEFPNIDVKMIQVMVPYLGAAPEEVEQGVCIRIEEAIEGTEGIEHITSSASEGVCSVMVALLESYDTNRALNAIKSKVDGIITFPAEIEKPVVSALSMRGNVLDIAIHGNADEYTIKHIGQELREDIAAMEGVSQVELKYTRPYEISIEVSEQMLRRYGLTLGQVAAAVSRASIDMPGGSIKTQGGEILLRTKGQAYRGQEFEDIVVLTRADGTSVRLAEIANIVDGFEEGDLRVRFDGQPAAMIKVFRVGDEDMIQIAEEVKQLLADRIPTMPEGISTTVWVDQSDRLRTRINALLGNAAGGLALVLVILTIFLRFRLALWVATGILVALLGAAMLFPLVGLSINSLSIIGFILALGIVVDDAIVVGERVYAHERNAENQIEASISGTHEVVVPVFFGVLTTVAAFMPLLFGTGRMGSFFAVVGFVVTVCLLFSLIESLLVLPAHLAHRRVKSRRQPNAFVKRWTRFQEGLADGLEHFARDRYRPFLLRCMEWRYLTISAGVGVLILTLALIASGRIVFGFFPSVEGDHIYASLTMPEGIAVEETMEATRQIERSAYELGEELQSRLSEGSANPLLHVITSVGTRISRGGGPGDFAERPGETHFAEVAIELAPPAERGGINTKEIANRWRELTGPIPDAVQMSFSADSFSFGQALAIQLKGRDIEELRMAAAELRAELNRFNGVFDVADTFRAGKQEVQLAIKPEAKTLGLTLNDLGLQVRQAFYGQQVQRIQRGTDDVRVMVRYPELERRSMGDLEDMRIRTADGTEVPFASVAEVKLGRGYSTISRYDRQRVVTVTGDVDRAIAQPEEIVRAVQRDVLPGIFVKYPSVTSSISGELEERMDVMSGWTLTMPIALLVIYALLAIPLKSYLQPLVIMSIIPFGVVGAIIGHYITGWDLVFPSVMGMVALSGVVVNSSLVMVDYVNRQRRLGVDVWEAVSLAGAVRFRPILLTSITTFFGLLPLIATANTATAFIVPMAISLAFGVLFATGITLLLVPSLYMIMEDWLAYLERWNKRFEPSEDSAAPL